MSSVLISLIFSLSPGAQGAPGNSVNVTFAPNTSSLGQNVPLPANYTAFPDVGFAYKLYPNRVSWNTARKQCVAEGANLAIVDSFKKVKYIHEMVQNPFGSHTGIHRLYDGIEWVSSKNDQPLAFIPWKPTADINAGTGDCVALWNDGSGVGPWNCKSVLPSVCEIPVSNGRDTDDEPKISHVLIDQRVAN